MRVQLDSDRRSLHLVRPVCKCVRYCLPKHDLRKPGEVVAPDSEDDQLTSQLIGDLVDGALQLIVQWAADFEPAFVLSALGWEAEHLDERLTKELGRVGEQVQRPRDRQPTLSVAKRESVLGEPFGDILRPTKRRHQLGQESRRRPRQEPHLPRFPRIGEACGC